jgi:DNA-binding Lrp family transcriptional regulator
MVGINYPLLRYYASIRRVKWAKRMDSIDQTLIAALRENGRASTAELARLVGRSRTSVQSRIERLEKQGVIAGYGVRLSPEHDRGAVRAHVMIKVGPKEARAVTAALRAIAQVRVLHSVSGDADLIAVAATASVADMDEVIDRIGALDGVERTTSSIILSTKFDR